MRIFQYTMLVKQCHKPPIWIDGLQIYAYLYYQPFNGTCVDMFFSTQRYLQSHRFIILPALGSQPPRAVLAESGTPWWPFWSQAAKARSHGNIWRFFFVDGKSRWSYCGSYGVGRFRSCMITCPWFLREYLPARDETPPAGNFVSNVWSTWKFYNGNNCPASHVLWPEGMSSWSYCISHNKNRQIPSKQLYGIHFL